MDCSRVDCESRLVMKSLNMTIPMMMKMMRRQTMMLWCCFVRCRLSSNPMVWLVRLLGHLRLGGFYIHATDHWVVRVSIQTNLQTFFL